MAPKIIKAIPTQILRPVKIISGRKEVITEPILEIMAGNVNVDKTTHRLNKIVKGL